MHREVVLTTVGEVVHQEVVYADAEPLRDEGYKLLVWHRHLLDVTPALLVEPEAEEWELASLVGDPVRQLGL